MGQRSLVSLLALLLIATPLSLQAAPQFKPTPVAATAVMDRSGLHLGNVDGFTESSSSSSSDSSSSSSSNVTQVLQTAGQVLQAAANAAQVVMATVMLYTLVHAKPLVTQPTSTRLQALNT